MVRAAVAISSIEKISSAFVVMSSAPSSSAAFTVTLKSVMSASKSVPSKARSITMFVSSVYATPSTVSPVGALFKTIFAGSMFHLQMYHLPALP